ncbi:hypothetical protein ACLD0V_16440, partial [Acinetobacter baumannii]
SSPQQIYGIRSTTYPSYALNLAQLGGFVFQIFVQQSLPKAEITAPLPSGGNSDLLNASFEYKVVEVAPTITRTPAAVPAP